MAPIVKTQGGRRIDVQNPLPVDGDSIYKKDIDISGSDIGGFSGTIVDLFDNVDSTIIDSSATNPKYIEVKLNRPIDTGNFSIAGSFSNVKILLKDPANNIVATIDDSANNTVYTAWEYATNPTGFCTIRIEFHTANAITLSFLCIKKNVHTHSQLLALKPDGTTTFIDATNGGNLKFSLEEFDDSFNTTPLPIKIENERRFVNRHLFQRQGVFIVPNAAITAGDKTITTDSTTGFNVGDSIFINEGTTEECDLFQITALVADTSITVTRPICNDYTIAAIIELVDENMANADGSSTTQIFKIQPPSDQTWHIQRLILFMKTGSQPDVSYFGDIVGGLSNGVVLRVNPGLISTFKTLAQWRDNGDMKQDMYDITFDIAAGPLGTFGIGGRWSFNKFGYSVELSGADGDSLETLIQDNLTVSGGGRDIVEFEIKVQGHIIFNI